MRLRRQSTPVLVLSEGFGETLNVPELLGVPWRNLPPKGDR